MKTVLFSEEFSAFKVTKIFLKLQGVSGVSLKSVQSLHCAKFQENCFVPCGFQLFKTVMKTCHIVQCEYLVQSNQDVAIVQRVKSIHLQIVKIWGIFAVALMHLRVICWEWDGSMEMDKTLHCINIHAATHFSRGEMAHFQTNTSPIHYSKPLDLCLCTHTTATNTLPHKHTCIYVCLLSEILEKSKSLCGDGLEWDYRTNVSSANVPRNVNVGL